MMKTALMRVPSARLASWWTMGIWALALGSSVNAQELNWIDQFGSSSDDSGAVLAGDGSGGAFVATNSGPPIFGPLNVVLAHRDSTGQETWIQTLGTTGGNKVLGAHSDGAGGVLLGGETSGSFGGPFVGGLDAWVGRYNASGGQVWLTQLGTAGGDSCWSAVADGAGGAFACGSTTGDLGGTLGIAADAWLAHLDATGTVTWLRQLDSGASDRAMDLVSDGSGGVYVCGDTSGELFDFTFGETDAWLARYDADGALLWDLQWGSVGSEQRPSLALNGVDGVFVAGSTTGALGAASAGGGDVWVTAVSASGGQAWIEQFGSAASDSCNAIASDLVGGLYLTGSTGGDLGGSLVGSFDGWVARLDGAGQRTWMRQFGTDDVDLSTDVAVNRPGRLLLCGTTTRDLGGMSAGGVDTWVASYDSLLPSSYCSSAVNSTGVAASISAAGSSAVDLGRLVLRCESLPRFAFGFFIVSESQAFAANPGGSQGNLCLGGSVGRFVGPGQVQNSGTAGAIEITVDLLALPQPLGPQAAQAGETWSFQAWYRDANPQVTSNFSHGLAVAFH